MTSLNFQYSGRKKDCQNENAQFGLKFKILEVTMHVLLEEARKAREKAIAPMSGVKVGAVLECSDGTLIQGCNIESAIPILSVCAERAAILTALAQGRRDFKRLAVIADFKNPITPCGACRQFISEFAPQVEIVIGNTKGAEKSFASVDELLPLSYKITDRAD